MGDDVVAEKIFLNLKSFTRRPNIAKEYPNLMKRHTAANAINGTVRLKRSVLSIELFL